MKKLIYDGLANLKNKLLSFAKLTKYQFTGITYNVGFTSLGLSNKGNIMTKRRNKGVQQASKCTANVLAATF
jgi:hypothetical protein